MKNDKFIMTAEGYLEAETELNELKNVRRLEIIEAIKEARAQGDLSENADYDAARARQAEVEARIKQIEHILANVQIIEDETGKKQKKIHMGSTVTFLDLSDNEEYTYTIVGSVEADPLSGKISNESALGAALLGKEISNKEVEVPSEVPYKIIIKSFN